MAIIRLQSEADRREGRYYEFDPGPPPGFKENLLGTGGMGTVYKGRMYYSHTRMYEYVAIKVVRNTQREDVIERARDEASIQIVHENMVRMYGFVETFDGDKRQYYVISEFLDGETLDHILRREGALPQAYALWIIKGVLSALAMLHSKGYIHRDIDPSNVMVCKGGMVKIIDFGIAKDMGKDDSFERRKTVYGQLIGKLPYAPPEQLTGNLHLISYPADIYSTGILLYELVTGKLPFTGTTYEVIKGQISTPIPLKPIAGKNLQYVIRKATAKAPKDRYQSANEFIVAIEQVEQGKRTRPAIQLVKPWLYAGAAVALAALAVVIALGAMRRTGPPDDGRYGEILSQASSELMVARYPQALEAYREAGVLFATDSIAQVITSLELFNQGLGAYTRSEYGRADSLFQRAAGLGLPDAYYYLGEMCYEGFGRPKDFSRGFELASQADRMGSKLAGYRLGLVYREGLGGVATDEGKAARYFDASRQLVDKASESGNPAPELLYMKGNMFRYGNGVAKSGNLAVEYYKEAALRNYPPAQFELYVMLNKEAPQEAMGYLARSAEGGYAKAQSLLGRLLLEERDRQGYEWLRQAAGKNYPYALAQLGVLYIDAKRVPGNRQIQETLGITGNDAVSQDYLQRALQYDPANYLANYGLGLYYYTGKSAKEAETYFRAAQKQISELHKGPYRKDELAYPNMERIREFINYVVK